LPSSLFFEFFPEIIESFILSSGTYPNYDRPCCFSDSNDSFIFSSLYYPNSDNPCYFSDRTESLTLFY